MIKFVKWRVDEDKKCAKRIEHQTKRAPLVGGQLFVVSLNEIIYVKTIIPSRYTAFRCTPA